LQPPWEEQRAIYLLAHPLSFHQEAARERLEGQLDARLLESQQQVAAQAALHRFCTEPTLQVGRAAGGREGKKRGTRGESDDKAGGIQGVKRASG